MEDLTPEQVLEVVMASGYLMEQEVASLLEDAGFVVSTNWAFRDQDKGVSRELDVHAFRMPFSDKQAGVYVSVEILCECKNSGTPLVFIGRNKSVADPHHVPLEYVFPFDNYEKEMPSEEPNTRQVWADPPWRHLNLAEHHYYYSRPDKAVQFCRICRNGKKIEANHGGVFDSLIYPLVKAVAAKRSSAVDMRKHMKGHVSLFFPIVVVNGPLFYIDSRSEQHAAVPVPHVSLMRQIDSETVKGEFLVEFVTKESLVPFVQDGIFRFADTIVTVAKKNPSLLLSKDIGIGEWDGKMPQ